MLRNNILSVIIISVFVFKSAAIINAQPLSRNYFSLRKDIKQTLIPVEYTNNIKIGPVSKGLYFRFRQSQNVNKTSSDIAIKDFPAMPKEQNIFLKLKRHSASIKTQNSYGLVKEGKSFFLKSKRQNAY